MVSWMSIELGRHRLGSRRAQHQPDRVRHRQPDRARLGGCPDLVPVGRAPAWSHFCGEGRAHCSTDRRSSPLRSRGLRRHAVGWGLWHREGEAFSWAGLAVTVLAIPIMYALAQRKRALAGQLGSRALRADAVEAIALRLAFVRRGTGAPRPVPSRRLVGSSGFSPRKDARHGSTRSVAMLWDEPRETTTQVPRNHGLLQSSIRPIHELMRSKPDGRFLPTSHLSACRRRKTTQIA
jgi:hypothetical protein